MKCATIQGRELSIFLLEVISSNDKATMDKITDQIFSLIKQFHNNLYGLSIALTNYYFETFWLAAWMDIQKGMTQKAQEILIWACDNAWKQDKAKAYNFHKGTPYFFLGRSYLLSGNLDLGFQMVHCGHTENLVVYPLLNKDYKDAPSYLFMTLKDNPHNALYDFVLIIKGKLKEFVDAHNNTASNPIPYETFDKKFLQRIGKEFDEIKFVLVYLLMSLVNLDTYEKEFLTNNSFSNLRKIELTRSLCLIVDKTLSEKYGTNTIGDGVMQYLVKHIRIPETDSAQLQNVLKYENGDPFLINVDVERVVKKLLANRVSYKNNLLLYPMKSMILAWNLRNFSSHNLSGIDQLLTKSYHSILSTLFSALFFAADVL